MTATLTGAAPVSGPANYEAAGRYAEQALLAHNSDEPAARVANMIALGQLHATLALAAAVALARPMDVSGAREREAWREALK